MEAQVKSILDVVRDYAISCHAKINQKYDKYLPYEFHQRMVVGVAHQFKFLIPEEKFELILMGCYLHDNIEDCGVTFNDVKSVCGMEAATLAFALANDKGKNRAERAGEKYYEGIRNTPYATFIKLCDRIANIEYGKMTAWAGGKMLDMYRKENESFKKALWDKEYAVMFLYIEDLLESNKAQFIERYPLEFVIFESELDSARSIIKQANTHYVLECVEEKEFHIAFQEQRYIFRVSCPTTSFASAYYYLGAEIGRKIHSKRKQ